MAVAYFERADLYSEKDQDDLAIADYDKAIKLKPDYWNAYLNRGFAFENKESFDYAIADYTQIINSSSDQFKPVAYLRRGSCYAQLRDKERATADLLKAIQLTIDPDIRGPAAVALDKLGYQAPKNQTPVSLTVFLQYIDAKDGDVVDAIGAALKNNGFKVEPKELIVRPTQGDIRYYSNSEEVKVNLVKIRTIVANTINERSKIRLNMDLSYLGKLYPYFPRGNIEVWIPSLQRSGLLQPLK